MITTLTLSGSVGKMGANKTADVMAVQTCLASIKVKMKPLYKSRIDGKCNKELIDAICAFQAAEQIKPSGKIVPADQTLSRLKLRVPSTVKVHALPMGSATRPGDTAKARELARRAAEQIRKLSSLPTDDAASLAKAILAAGEDGIPVTLSKVDVTHDSKFQVTLAIAKAALPPSADPSFMRSLAQKVSAHIAQSARWSSGTADTLAYRTMQAIPGLKPGAVPSKAFAARIATDTSKLDKTQNAILAAIEKNTGLE